MGFCLVVYFGLLFSYLIWLIVGVLMIVQQQFLKRFIALSLYRFALGLTDRYTTTMVVLDEG